jgi:hypothetical protein
MAQGMERNALDDSGLAGGSMAHDAELAFRQVKMASGEYTAASVGADPTDATKLDLVKETDGNYGTTPPVPTGGAAAVQSSSTVLASLASLKLGGN